MPEPTAAQALYGHLPSGEGREVEQRSKPPTSQAMFPSLPSLVPKPERQLSPAELKEAWRDHMLALAGLRRMR
jgi:hypothetical protein